MSSIKFNHSTREIEMKGTESFIESNFGTIQDLLVENFGVKKMKAPGTPNTNQEARSFETTKDSRPGVGSKSGNRLETSSIVPAPKPVIPDISHELKAKRPPLRKYIRKEGIPGQQRMVVEVVEQKPREISIASLKEKFGLSESKIGGIIRDAEKLGKIRKAQNGSYVWSQD